jgi:hypothetical protein
MRTDLDDIDSSKMATAEVSEADGKSTAAVAASIATDPTATPKQQQDHDDESLTSAVSSTSQSENGMENGDESDYDYESDYEYQEEEEDCGKDCGNECETGRRQEPSHKKPKFSGKGDDDWIEIDENGEELKPTFSNISLMATLPPPSTDILTHSSNFTTGFCGICQNQENHVPVVDCDMIKEWNRLVDDFGNGLLDIDPDLMKHAMKKRVEECHRYLHEVLRAADGWPLSAAQREQFEREPDAASVAVATNVAVRGSERVTRLEQQRADRFFAQKTVDVVAADLLHYGWDTRAWRNALLQRRNLEVGWLEHSNRRNNHRYHQRLVARFGRQIVNLGLDPMCARMAERQDDDTDDSEGEIDVTQARHNILAEHEAFLRGTMEDDTQTNAQAPRAPAVAQDGSTNAEGGVISWLRGVLPGGGAAAAAPAAIATNSGLRSVWTNNDNGAWICPICMDDEVEPEDRISVEMPNGVRGVTESCGHYYCRDCWTSYIHAWLEDVRGTGGGNMTARCHCPHPQCLASVTRGHVEKVVNQVGTSEITETAALHPLLKFHDDLALYSFVLGYRNTICWCPGPNCNKIMVHCGIEVLVPDGDGPGRQQGHGYFTFCSTCTTRFCFHCGASREDHDAHQGFLQCPNFLQLDNNEAENATGLTGINNEIVPAARPPAQPDAAANNAALPQADPPLNPVIDINCDKIRLCPSCRIPIEKNGGCAHMTCRCGTHFCWLCMAVTTDMGHFCGREGAGDIYLRNQRAQENQQEISQLRLARMDLDYLIGSVRPESEGAQSSEYALDVNLYPELASRHKKLNRFAHYYNRYVFHRQGQHFAENQCECVINRATNYSQMSKLKSAVETEFFPIANQRLVTSRRILKYSYCFLFYKLQPTEESQEEVPMIGEGSGCPSDNALSASLPVSLALFLDHQERLERVTESLSFLSENALTPEDRQRVLEMVSSLASVSLLYANSVSPPIVF